MIHVFTAASVDARSCICWCLGTKYGTMVMVNSVNRSVANELRKDALLWKRVLFCDNMDVFRAQGCYWCINEHLPILNCCTARWQHIDQCWWGNNKVCFDFFWAVVTDVTFWDFFYPDYHTLNHFTTNILALWACALTGSPSNMSVAICWRERERVYLPSAYT